MSFNLIAQVLTHVHADICLVYRSVKDCQNVYDLNKIIFSTGRLLGSSLQLMSGGFYYYATSPFHSHPIHNRIIGFVMGLFLQLLGMDIYKINKKLSKKNIFESNWGKWAKFHADLKYGNFYYLEEFDKDYYLKWKNRPSNPVTKQTCFRSLWDKAFDYTFINFFLNS